MADPYRSTDGVPCLRCRLPLTEDDRHDLVCPDGCGRWVSAKTLDSLLGTAELVPLGRPAPYWKVTALPESACPVCGVALVDLYRQLRDDASLTLGLCMQHGVWLERATRADLEAAYAEVIGERAAAAMLRAETGPEAADRIELLERRIAKLERQLAEVRSFVGTRFRWTAWRE